MKRINEQMPQPVTLADSLFMRNLLAAVRLRRDYAIGKYSPTEKTANTPGKEGFYAIFSGDTAKKD